VFFVGVLFASRPHTRPVTPKPAGTQGHIVNEGSHI
jgi:hypothetical protein